MSIGLQILIGVLIGILIGALLAFLFTRRSKKKTEVNKKIPNLTSKSNRGEQFYGGDFYRELEEAHRIDTLRKIQTRERQKNDPKYIYHGPKFSEAHRVRTKYHEKPRK